MNPQQAILKRLKTMSQKSLANELGVSEAYLSDVINGRRDAGDKLLKPLGIERVVTYKRRK